PRIFPATAAVCPIENVPNFRRSTDRRFVAARRGGLLRSNSSHERAVAEPSASRSPPPGGNGAVSRGRAGGEDVPHPGRQGEHRQTDRGPHAAPPLRAPARGRPIRVRLRSGAKSMRIQCPNCPAAYELDAGRVPPPGLDGELPVPSAGAAMCAPAGQPDLDAAFAPPPPDSGGSLDDAFPVADDTALTPKRQVEETDLAPKASADELPPPSPE